MRDIELENAEKAANDIIDDIDKTADEEAFNKELEKRKKEIQEQQDEYNKLMLDDSEWANSQRDDLKKQLEEQQNSLDEFLDDRSREKRKEAISDQLEKDTEEINDRYDNLVNDERNFKSIEDKILKGKITDISKQMDTFTKFVNKNMEDIGKSISNNLVDRLKEASNSLNVVLKGNTTGVNVAMFDTGGETGSWAGGGGKLAILHPEEKVLNKGETAMFKQAADIMQGLDITKGLNVTDFIKKTGIGSSVSNNNDNRITNFNWNVENMGINDKDAMNLVKREIAKAKAVKSIPDTLMTNYGTRLGRG